MISIAPSGTARAAYRESLQLTLSAAARLVGLPEMPTATLTLNAAFYLESYLPAVRYHAALDTALARAAAERSSWQALPSGVAPGGAALHALLRAGRPRAMLYGWLFEQAVASGQPQRLLLAQHACEMAELLDDADLPLALRFGLLDVPLAERAVPTLAALPPSSTLIEGLSRALLCRRIDAPTFVQRLLTLHAANRARALAGPDCTSPLALAAAPILPLLSEAAMRHVPSRLRVTQPCELALRAGEPLAVLAIEAGLVEAETLSSGQHLLLLAALDRALAG